MMLGTENWAHMYAITNSKYPGNCGVPLSLPVVEDGHPASAVTVPFRAQLQIGRPFSVTLDQAIQAADRHVYVQGQPPNPVAFVEDWINLLRWEVSTLWEVRAADSSYLRDVGRNLTHEHYKRSGEVLAEGLAIVFLEERLGIPRQRFFFVNGSGLRPDFVVKLKPRHCRALLHNRLRFMLEVRSRSNMRSLSARDRRELAGKKTLRRAAGVLAVYACYGDGRHRDGTARTRLHLADPPGDEGREASDGEVSEIVIHHYLRITSQLGLWHHRDHLLRAAKNIDGELQNFSRSNQQTIPSIVRRKAGNQTYQGREFNELIALASHSPATAAEHDSIRERIKRRVSAGEFGGMVFRGLNETVLRFIEESSWLKLAEYQDADAKEFKVDHWIRSDGVFRSEVAIESGSDLAKDLVESLRPFLG